MKIRDGFVSNSSSSSFVIGYNAEKPIIDKETLIKILNALVEVEKITRPNVKFENIFNLEYEPDHMYIGDEKDILECRRKWEANIHDSYQKTDIEKCRDKIIIHSAEENSIPHWMKEYLEYELCSKFWHWG